MDTLGLFFCTRLALTGSPVALTAPEPTANIEILAAGLLIRLDGLARQSFDRLARSQSGPRRLAWPRTSPFHGGNTGSNPVGDAKSSRCHLAPSIFHFRFLNLGGLFYAEQIT